ncbi:hypothetical protein [Microcoleus sp. FACHB-672]|nr:hypothetical protein [Microcoleus sp. FACHB-672]MBD2039266.1 hypothetical protein [Microcoleus sp. FACHB-672]
MEDDSCRHKFAGPILTCSRREQHTLLIVARFSVTIPGKTEPVRGFHKLD